MCLERGYRNFAVIAEDGPFGEDLAYQFGTEFDAQNAHVVYRSSYVRDRVDFREKINELKGVDADVIIFAGLENAAATFIKVARGLGLKTPIVGSFSDTPEMHEIAGPALNSAAVHHRTGLVSVLPLPVCTFSGNTYYDRASTIITAPIANPS